MTAMGWDILLVLFDASIWFVLVYLLRSETARLPRKGVYALCMVMAVLMAAAYPLWIQWQAPPLNAASQYSGFIWLIFAPAAFIVYPGCPYKNLFLLFSSSIIIITGSGIGNLVELVLPIQRSANLLIRFFVDGTMLAVISLITQRQFPGLYKAGYRQLWRQMWIITVLLCFTGIVSTGYVVTESTPGYPGFIPGRLCMAFAIIIIIYITGLADRQAEEVTSAKAQAAEAEATALLKDQEYTRILEGSAETARMRHDLRQMFAAMQGLNNWEHKEELISFCEEILEAMDQNKKEIGRENT